MGVHNPQMVIRGKYPFGMAKRKIVSHAARITRETLVCNFRLAVERSYPELAPNTAYLKISRAVGCSLSTLQRISSGETSPQVDTLADIAWHLGTSVSALLTPQQGQPKLRNAA